MQIEISEKEKTALSILLGLRQKFALAKRKKETYSALELHTLFSEVISKINKDELRYLDTITVAHAAMIAAAVFSSSAPILAIVFVTAA